MKKATDWSKDNNTTAPVDWSPTSRTATDWAPVTTKLPVGTTKLSKTATDFSKVLEGSSTDWSNDAFTLDALIGSGTIGGGFIGRPL